MVYGYRSKSPPRIGLAMAEKKKPQNSKIKPEEVIRAKKRVVVSQPKPVPKPRPKPKKRHKKHISVKKIANKRVNNPIFVSILAIVLSIFVVFTWVYVSRSVKETNNNLDQASKSANGVYLIAKKEAELIKIIGTKMKRQSEVVNYQSAPDDLQKFVDADYKIFKQQCIVNGKLPSGVSYEISNIIYDSYAVIKRGCNGTESTILKKFDKKWAVVFSGNIYPACSLVNDLDIPQGASMYCDLNGVTYLNPNP